MGLQLSSLCHLLTSSVYQQDRQAEELHGAAMEADEARPVLFPSKLLPYCPHLSHQNFCHFVLVEALFWLRPPHPPTAVKSSLLTGTISSNTVTRLTISKPARHLQAGTTPPSPGAPRSTCDSVLSPPVHSLVGEALCHLLQ